MRYAFFGVMRAWKTLIALGLVATLGATSAHAGTQGWSLCQPSGFKACASVHIAAAVADSGTELTVTARMLTHDGGGWSLISSVIQWRHAPFSAPAEELTPGKPGPSPIYRIVASNALVGTANVRPPTRRQSL